MFQSKNYFSPDGRNYFTSDPYRVAFLLTRGCQRLAVNGGNPDAVVFEITGDNIPALLDELHSGTKIEYDVFVHNYKKVMAEIRDVRAAATKGGGHGNG